MRAALIAAVAGCAIMAMIDFLNEHISRCSDDLAPQYIVGRAERLRACGHE